MRASILLNLFVVYGIALSALAEVPTEFVTEFEYDTVDGEEMIGMWSWKREGEKWTMTNLARKSSSTLKDAGAKTVEIDGEKMTGRLAQHIRKDGRDGSFFFIPDIGSKVMAVYQAMNDGKWRLQGKMTSIKAGK